MPQLIVESFSLLSVIPEGNLLLPLPVLTQLQSNAIGTRNIHAQLSLAEEDNLQAD
jgi:hypothetical protein